MNPNLFSLLTTNTDDASLMDREPAVALGTAMTAFLAAVFALLRAFNVAATAEMEAATTAFVVALLMFPAISGFLIRFFVFSPNSAAEIAQGTYNGGK